MDPYLCLVLTAELLFGNGLSDQSKPSQCILSHRDKLFDLLEEHKGVITEMEKQKGIATYSLIFIWFLFSIYSRN